MNTRNLFQTIAAVALSIVSLSGLSGCAVLAVGAVVGTIAYVEGELVAYVNADMFETVSATNLAASDLGLRALSRTGDEVRATMVAEDSYGNKITIRLLPETPLVTKVKIRVGNIGDQGYSQRIFKEIERHVPR